ncbi:MAG: metallophosphoesterase, partial [Nanoarchaeota archaeon]|nr:metallophosphoesterase [Nanoarchaeota archaeon]
MSDIYSAGLGVYYWESNLTANGDSTASQRSFGVYDSLCDYALNGSTFLSAVTETSAKAGIVANDDVDFFMAVGTSSGNYTLNTSVTEDVETLYSAEVNLTGLTANTRYFYRPYVRRNGTSENYCAFHAERNFTTTRPSGTAFSWAHLTDSHWYRPFIYQPNVTGQNRYLNTTEQIRSEDFDFVIDTGDTAMTHVGCTAASDQADTDFRYLTTRNAYAADLPFPIYMSLGNHEAEFDFGGTAGHSEQLMNWSTLSRLKYWTAPTNETYSYGGSSGTLNGQNLRNYYAFDYGDATFIILDTYRYNNRSGGIQDPSQWTLGREQFEWLNQTLASSNKKWKFLFGHHILGGGDNSVCGYHYGDGGGNYSQTGDAQYGQIAINPLMERYNAQFYVYGHVHHFAHDWANWASYNRTNYVNYVLASSPTQDNVCADAERVGMYDNEICEWGYAKFDVSPNNVTLQFINQTGEVLYSYTENNTAPSIVVNYTN